jgi:hypothetical protein
MVNTFVTSRCLKECARNLDNKRLGKQRVEAKQIIEALETPGKSSWERHPATKMWKGHVNALKVYYNHIVREWIARGYVNNLPLYTDINEDEYKVLESFFDGKQTTFLYPKQEKEEKDVKKNEIPTKKRKKTGIENTSNSEENNDKVASTSKTFPLWFGWEPFIYSHRAALIRKAPEHYQPLFLEEKIEPYMYRGYIWPASLPSTAFDNFEESFFTEMSMGTPSHYRLSVENVIRWSDNRQINPTTGRSITIEGTLYKDYYKAYNVFVKNGLITATATATEETIIETKKNDNEKELEEERLESERSRRIKRRNTHDH